MRKTIFKGTVNGETFDNVAAYNARLQKLLNSGETVEASSETKVNVEDEPTSDAPYTTTTTLDAFDEDLTIYPYMCEDDPFYLDLLVTDDPVTNQEAYNEAQNVLDKCYRYTQDVMSGCCNCERKEYLEDVTEIIDNINNDITDTIRAIDKVNAKKKKAEEAYHAEMNNLNKDLDLLEAADKVSNMFKAYYEDVQNEMRTMIKEGQNKGCDKSCTNDVVETTVTEKTPQTEWDFNKLMDAIFGPGLIRTRR